MYYQYQRRSHGQRHRRKLLVCIVRQLGIYRRVDGQHAGVAQQQGVAIRRRARHIFRTDHPITAGAVVHDHRRPPTLHPLLPQQTRHHIRRPAGRIGHHQAYRLDRISILGKNISANVRAEVGVYQRQQRARFLVHYKRNLAAISRNFAFCTLGAFAPAVIGNSSRRMIRVGVL